MAIKFKSLEYKVKEVKRKSKARYAVGIKEGDIIRFEVDLESTTGATHGSYAIWFELFVNDIKKLNLSQNEVPKMEIIFDLESII